MYPYTTSSSTTSGGACTGLGIAPGYIGRVTGVAKAIQSHVGGGPFVTEITDREILDKIHGDMAAMDAEKGTTTGRVRRLGYLDIPQIRRAQMVNGTGEGQTMALTKLDWVPRLGEEALICVGYDFDGSMHDIAPDSANRLSRSTPIYSSLPTWQEDIQNVRHYQDLPPNARRYVEFIEGMTQIPISILGVGPRRDQVIVR